jgi:hypothetical protein
LILPLPLTIKIEFVEMILVNAMTDMLRAERSSIFAVNVGRGIGKDIPRIW